MKDIDWTLLVELYNHRNLTRVSEKLYISQPALSKMLNRIEDELGTKVIVRTNKGVNFTDAGEYLVAQALQISKLITETTDHFDELKRGEGELSIGSASSFARYSLPKIMREYNQGSTSHRYKVNTMTSSEIMEAVRHKEFQVGFVNGDRDWDTKILCSVGKGFILSKDPIKMEDLPNIPLICHHRDAYSLRALSNWWKENFDMPFRITYSVSDIATSLRWISDGLGYGIMYDTALGANDLFFKMPMMGTDGNQIVRRTWAIYLPERMKEPGVREFITFLKSKFEPEKE